MKIDVFKYSIRFRRLGEISRDYLPGGELGRLNQELSHRDLEQD